MPPLSLLCQGTILRSKAGDKAWIKATKAMDKAVQRAKRGMKYSAMIWQQSLLEVQEKILQTEITTGRSRRKAQMQRRKQTATSKRMRSFPIKTAKCRKKGMERRSFTLPM